MSSTIFLFFFFAFRIKQEAGSLTRTGPSITSKLISVFTFAAEGPGMVVADCVGTADLRILSALVNV